MTETQVLPMQPQQHEQQQLLQQLRRDLNRLNDSNRATRLHGARAILFRYTEEASRRAAASSQTISNSNNNGDISTNPRGWGCIFSRVFLSNVYTPISALCADEASECCRTAALNLLQVVVTKFLPREEVVALCNGSKSSSRVSNSGGAVCNGRCSNSACCCEYASREHKGTSGRNRSSCSQSATSLVVILAERLKDASGSSETSEELRALVLQLLQQLLQCAADPPSLYDRPPDVQDKGQQGQTEGWNATRLADHMLAAASGALRDKNPANAVDACRLLSAMSKKLGPSALLQVGYARKEGWPSACVRTFF